MIIIDIFFAAIMLGFIAFMIYEIGKEAVPRLVAWLYKRRND